MLYILTFALPVAQPEWIDRLEQEWEELIQKQIHHSHGFDVKTIEKQNRNHARLLDKYRKLKEDHKMLLSTLCSFLLGFLSACNSCLYLDLASHLVTSLEHSLRGQNHLAADTVEYYCQEMKHLSSGDVDEDKVISLTQLILVCLY